MATVEVTDGAIAIPSTDLTEPADPFGDRGEKSAVKQGVRDAITARTADETWRVSVGATDGDRYHFDFELNGEVFGPGLWLAVSELHTRAGTDSTYNKVRGGVEEGVQLYVEEHTIFGGRHNKKKEPDARLDD